MRLIVESIRFPVTTAVGVILLVMFGLIALFRLPVQLTPNVEDPIVSVVTRWSGASPEEIEQEIIQEQEDQLKSLEGLREMESESFDGSGEITLTFGAGEDMDAAVLRVSNRLQQVPEYPADADRPIIRTSNPNRGAIAWFSMGPTETGGFEGDVWTLWNLVDDVVRPEIERVPGVAASNIYGGRRRELHVLVDPAKLAARRVTLNEVAAALDAENRDYSGGDFDEGKRRYLVRTVGEFRDALDVESIVVARRNGVPVYLRDIGRAQIGFEKETVRVYGKGTPVIAINAAKDPDSNIFDVMQGVQATVRRLNADRLAELGLRLQQVYDETDYVSSSIDLVRQSLIVGGLLAIVTLLVFLRSGTSTLVVAIAIPISLVGSFLALHVLGRSLNVISLAGMAFAVGMVVDNSIVVLENIYRHRQMGKSRAEAARAGAEEVWGAVLASTVTTIAVFVPVFFMREEVGQLFGDIALAISCAVALSLLVSITVIPSLAAKILRGRDRSVGSRGYRDLWGAASYANRIRAAVADLVHLLTGSVVARVGVVLTFTVAAVGLSWLLMPKIEYLPVGNQNFVFGVLLPPPGYSLDEVTDFERTMTSAIERLWEHPAGSPEAEALAGGGIKNYFFVARGRQAFLGVRSNDALRARELIPELLAASREMPGTIFVVNQRSLFDRRRGQGRNVDIDLSGPDLERLVALGREVYGGVRSELAEAQVQPIPSLDLGNPEVRVRTHRRRAADLGLSNRELAFAVSALVDGAKASDFRYEGQEIDLILKAEPGSAHRTHLLEQMPIATPDGSLVTLGAVADLSVVSGPVQINHRERQRTVTIRVTPPATMPLETAVQVIEERILAPMRDAGRLGGLYDAGFSGAARKLVETARALRWNLLLALAIVYLLMAALFENFVHPLVILFSVPLATLGGFLGLRVMNLFTIQPLDVLTMLGFIILIGTVVNNAILIVHQALNHIRHEGLDRREAIREAVRIRMRPIFMSVSTSVFGMLPLVLFPGAGAELYRGLGSVVVGGLALSAVFTLVLVPALFSLSLDAEAAVSAWAARFSRSGRSAAFPGDSP